MIALPTRFYFWYYGFPKPLAEEGLRSADQVARTRGLTVAEMRG
jgi:hypothetical protein